MLIANDISMPKHLVFSLIVVLKKGCLSNLVIIVMGRAENISPSAKLLWWKKWSSAIRCPFTLRTSSYFFFWAFCAALVVVPETSLAVVLLMTPTATVCLKKKEKKLNKGKIFFVKSKVSRQILGTTFFHEIEKVSKLTSCHERRNVQEVGSQRKLPRTWA